MRRIFAVTGTGTLDRMRAEEAALAEAADKLRAGPDELPAAIDRLLERVAAAEKEVRAARSAAARASGGSLAASAVDGVVVARVDGMSADELKELAVSVREQGVRVVVVAGSPDGERVALAGAATKDAGVEVNKLIGEIAKRAGGGGGGKDPTTATAGGRDVGAIDDALALAKERLGGPATGSA
jgi:alanyl-tRNA synthetase